MWRERQRRSFGSHNAMSDTRELAEFISLSVQHSLVPHTGNFSLAFWAPAVFHPIQQHLESPPLDEHTTATRTVCIFIPSNASGQIPCVHIVQPGILSNFRRTNERGDRGVIRICHFVILVKSRHMPGDVRRDRH